MKDSKMLELMGRGLAWENVTKAKTNSAGHSLIGIAPRVAAMEAEVDGLRKDAERYRWLRAQHWNDNTIAAVRRPKDAMKLGHDAPSGERLDALIDEAMIETPNAPHEGPGAALSRTVPLDAVVGRHRE